MLAIGLVGCGPGERGAVPKEQAAPVAAAAPVPVAAPVAAAPVGEPGSCEATAAKLVELSVIEGKAAGREWSVEKQAQKRDQFVTRCQDELPAGKVTRETLLCVEAATELSQAQACLLAATR